LKSFSRFPLPFVASLAVVDVRSSFENENMTALLYLAGGKKMNNSPGNKNPKKKQLRKKKRTALIICQDETRFWTTQNQFWQWVRDLKIVKLKDSPLTGRFNRPYEELLVVLGSTVLNLAHREHLQEALASRRYMRQR
jgi:hypothetical protein